ncbi:MAG: winged helix-turn-helix domain-containing protein [Candidatus Acidiferrales bacterium]
MSEELLSSTGVSPVFSDIFERLLRRAALVSHRNRFESGVINPAPAREYSQPIGDTAGTLWQLLSEDGPSTLASLIQEVGVPESLFFMAVGWLAREGKIEFEPHDGDYTIHLR